MVIKKIIGEKIIMKQLRIKETVLIIDNVYPFRYDYGKGREVLRIDILEKDHSFEEIKSVLKDCKDTISHYEQVDESEEYVLKNNYDNYSIDFNCQYNAGTYGVEITRKSDQEIRLELLENAFTELLLGGM